jgi:hypothetical protein
MRRNAIIPSRQTNHSNLMRIPRTTLVFTCAALLLSSCGGKGAAAATPTPFEATASPSTETLPPTSSASPTASVPPAPTATDTAPSGGLNAAGPYAVFEGPNGVWIANPDGGFPTRISEKGLGAGQDLRAAFSPRGDRMAMAAETKTGLDLLLIGLPGGETTVLARLLETTRVERMLNSLSPEAFAYSAIMEYPSLAWRPADGNVLAYIGGGKEPNADLYTYDLTWEKTRHVEAQPSQAVRPVWSPDGDYLLFFGVEWLPPYGPTLVTHNPMAGFWAVHVADNQLLPQPAPAGTYRNFLGWRDSSRYLVYDSDGDCPARRVRAVDISTGETSPIAEFCLSTPPAFSPENGALLLSVDAGCGCGIEEGVYLLLPGADEPVRLMAQAAFELSWLPESGLFYAYPYALFTPDGMTRCDPPAVGSSYRPAVSVTGRQAWQVAEEKFNSLVIREPGGEWQTVLEGGIAALLWDPLSGETLLIALENGELFAAAAPDFTPRSLGLLAGPIERAAWTPAGIVPG